MAATYIRPTLADFEAVFSVPNKKDPSKRAFDLIRPQGQEAYYLCVIRENSAGKLCLKVLTSVAADHASARGCGEDAIRIALYWCDAEGWEKPLGKGKRVNRSGGAGSTAADVVRRAFERAREVVTCRGTLPACSKCGRPMVARVAKASRKVFYGCIAWKPSGGCNGVDWNVDAETQARMLAEQSAKAQKRQDDYEGRCEGEEYNRTVGRCHE